MIFCSFRGMRLSTTQCIIPAQGVEGSNPGNSESDNSAIYQDTTQKFDIHPYLFLIYFFFLRAKEKTWLLKSRLYFTDKPGVGFPNQIRTRVLCVFWLTRKKLHNKTLKYRTMEGKKWFAYGTRHTLAVTHPVTNRARRCLTSVIGRELLVSTCYGRRHKLAFRSRHMLNFRFPLISPLAAVLSLT